MTDTLRTQSALLTLFGDLPVIQNRITPQMMRDLILSIPGLALGVTNVQAAPYSATGDGATNDRTSFANADAVGGSALAPLASVAYLINSNITLASAWTFGKGAILKPANGVTITFSGSIEAGLYQIFDLSLGGTIAFGKLAAAKIRPEHFGAVGDGATTDSTPIQQWASALAAVGAEEFHFTPGQNYAMATGVSFTLPEHSTIYAEGVKFTVTGNVTAFNLNPNAVWDGSDGTTIRLGKWKGGYASNTNATKTASRFIKAHHMRNFTVDGVRADTFWRAVEIAGKDTYHIDNCLFGNNQYDIYHPTDAEIGLASGGDLPLDILLNGNEHSGTLGVTHVFMGTKISTFVSRDCSYNGSLSGPKLYFSDSSILYGEGYTIDTCHFETSQAGQQNVHFEDVNSQGFYGIKISGCTIGGGQVGWKGFKFQRCRRVEIGTNVFRDGTGGATEEGLNFDANCVDFTVAQTCEFIGPFATPLVLSASISRDRYSILPEYRTAAVVVTGYNGVVVSTGNATITMSTAISSKWPAFGIPKGYQLSLLALDSGSAAAASCRVAVQTSSGGVTNNALRVDLPGAPNSTRRMVGGYVAADASGNIYIDYIASGAGTMTIILFVQAIIM